MADETWTQERQLSRPGAVTSCAWSPDGMRLASVGGGRVGVWDVYSPITGSLPHHPNIQHSATVWCPQQHAKRLSPCLAFALYCPLPGRSPAEDTTKLGLVSTPPS